MANFELIQFDNDELRCLDVLKLLGDYVDLDLAPAMHTRVCDHIEKCSSCQELEESYRKTIELAAELGDRPIPLEVQNRLRKALNERVGTNLSMVPG